MFLLAFCSCYFSVADKNLKNFTAKDVSYREKLFSLVEGEVRWPSLMLQISFLPYFYMYLCIVLYCEQKLTDQQGSEYQM